MIDDDNELARAMMPVFKTYSIDVEASYTPEDGLQRLREQSYDLLMLDIMLPDINGFELCRQIRMSKEPHHDVPIIMLTARADLTDLVVGLETGADDYVTKPFEPRELVARIHAVRRRFQERAATQAAKAPESEEHISFQLDNAFLTIDPVKARAYVGQTPVTLTSMEYELLLVLAKNSGQAFSRDDLIYALQGINRICTRSIDAIVYRLRQKLRHINTEADFIRTVRGRGYSLIGMRILAPPPDQRPGVD
ncbi:response regulator transcription factor [uncultured Rhodospira sp.]|uniref:response regulator transcription factor n=1 Tax=uncultured Rhodospira sp. TaxID=1936189 RepID=UPI002638FA2B|nr:response regulator transcription factor [uncultured Rhodospira sp.]